jgi:hypothetical protein
MKSRAEVSAGSTLQSQGLELLMSYSAALYSQNLLAIPDFDDGLLPRYLLGDQWRNVGLEPSGTETHNNDGDDEKTDDSTTR